MKIKREILFQLRGELSRTYVSKQIGITPQMLGMIERGDRNPSLELAKSIADFYGKTVEELFFPKEEEPFMGVSK